MVAIVAALWFRGEHYAKRAATSEALLRASIAIGNANAQLAQNQAKTAKRIDAVASLASLRKAEIRAKSGEVRKVINDAPPENDGPLAPVLRDQLDRLPKPASAIPNNSDPAAGSP